MAEHQANANRWNFRVIEWPVRQGPSGAVPGRMAIRRVTYDATGKPALASATSPVIEGPDGDELLLLINALAEALTKPSVLSDEVEMPS